MMSVVYLAQDLRHDRPVALKVLPNRLRSGRGAWGAQEVILLVEDDGLVRGVLARSLREYGYQMVNARPRRLTVVGRAP